MTTLLPPAVVAARLATALPRAVVAADGDHLEVAPGALLEALRFLRDDADLDLAFLANLTAVDREAYFEVVYHLQSLDRNQMLVVKARVVGRDDPHLPSAVPAYRGALLQEREVYDLFGIRFVGHPDLRRMLLWDGFPGYPLRKDFLRMPGAVSPGLPGFPHEPGYNAWPVPGSVTERPVHPNAPGVPRPGEPPRLGGTPS